MFLSLKGKIALVTGAAQGVGLAVTKRFLEADIDHVIMLDINAEKGEAEAAKLPDAAEFYQLDVTDTDAVIKLMEYVKEKYGRVDILSNNAGMIFGDTGVEDVPLEECEACMNVNYMGYLRMIKYAVPLMPDGSSIVNICSIAGRHAFAGYLSYNASKGAVRLLTESVALELGDRGIRCNAVSPHSINGPMLDQPGCEAEKAMAEIVPAIPRPAEAFEVAALVHFLASDDSKFITGANIPIDGGLTNICYSRGVEREIIKHLDM